jgi:chromosomal replication initiator protein
LSVTIAQIQKEVCQEFGITAGELLAPARDAKFAHPRAIAMALAREVTKASYPAIGRAFDRHHTTVVSAVKRSHNLLDSFPEYFDRRKAVLRRLGVAENTP